MVRITQVCDASIGDGAECTKVSLIQYLRTCIGNSTDVVIYFCTGLGALGAPGVLVISHLGWADVTAVRCEHAVLAVHGRHHEGEARGETTNRNETEGEHSYETD